MQIPLETTYRNVPKSERIDELIRQKALKLEQVCPHMIRCDVTIEKPQEHQNFGNPYAVRIEMSVPPGHDIVVKRDPSKNEMHDPLSTVIRDAFDAARKKVKTLVDKQRHETKKHPEQEVQGFVREVFPDENYGFIRSLDGKDIYFHKNSVLHNDFQRIKEGTGVRYVEEDGEKGPQASTVAIVDKPF